MNTLPSVCAFIADTAPQIVTHITLLRSSRGCEWTDDYLRPPEDIFRGQCQLQTQTISHPAVRCPVLYII